MQQYGIYLRGTYADIASLHILVDTRDSLVNTAWTSIRHKESLENVLLCAKLDEVLCKKLEIRGLDLVTVQQIPKGYRIAFVNNSRKAILWSEIAEVHATYLLEALRPIPIDTVESVEKACFIIPTESEAAKQTLERLLALGRDDVALSEWFEDNKRFLLIEISKPPLYLLMRAKEEREEEVRAYVSTDASHTFWIEWGFRFPLASLAKEGLQKAKQIVFVDAKGTWHYGKSEWSRHSLYDALLPEFAATQLSLQSASGKTKFRIPLKLSAAPEVEPELWLLREEEFWTLESFIESATPDQISRFTFTRNMGPSGVCYLLRELVRLSQARLGVRISELLENKGFYRAGGTDNLYLPVGRKLLPTMRRDELRTLLQLDQATWVIIAEDSDGPQILSVQNPKEESLRSWVEYIATDRRVELDRLLEKSVFDFSEIQVEKPKKSKRQKAEQIPERVPPPKRIRQRLNPVKPKRPEKEAEENPVPEGIDLDARDEARIIREQIREYEKELLEGGYDSVDVWQTLGELKEKVGEKDEASFCFESALFYSSEKKPDTVEILSRLRTQLVQATGTPEELLDLSLKRAWNPNEASYLGALFLKQLGENTQTIEDVFQQSAKVFYEFDLPVSRRLAWVVLYSYYRHADDKLGLTRAKEKILGSINDKGLSETFDLPGFVRFALALEGEDSDSLSRTRDDQLAALESLWVYVLETHVNELDSLSAYMRLNFALGFMRLGSPKRARDLIIPIENEISVHDHPNRVLFRLYMTKIAHLGAKGETPWESEVETALSMVPDLRIREVIEWLRKKSLWLQGEQVEEKTPWLRPALERLLVLGEIGQESLGKTLSQAFENENLYDYEITTAIERMSRAALKSGNDEAIGEILWLARQELTKIQILGHRAKAIGICLRSAAMLGDSDMVDTFLDHIVTIARAKQNRPSVRELLSAVRPAIFALRRLGAGKAASRLLNALEVVTSEIGREGPRLMAALADGFIQLKEQSRAEELLDRAITTTLQTELPYVDRYQSAAAILDALKHWPMTGRAPRGERFLKNLGHFRDTFTVGKFYPTFQVLLLEKLIDSVSDEVTLRSDRVQSYLDAEEQAIRRQILTDWKQLCGR